MKKMLITVNGEDQPGIIAKISGLLFARGANLEDISMTLLEGQFAMMMAVSLPSRRTVTSILEALKLLEASPWSLHCDVTVLSARAVSRSKHAARSLSHVITAFGKDRTGIVFEVSRALAGLRVNITDLDSRILGKGSKANYAMLLEVDVPSADVLKKLRPLLVRVAKKLKIEIQMKPLERLTF